MTLSFSQLGKLGRLGNSMFQAASTIGIARKNGLAPVFPAWPYERYFETPLPHGSMNNTQVKEDGFLYHEIPVKPGTDLFGYLQSKKYWQDSEQEVVNQFTFKKSMYDYFKTRSNYARIFEKEVIAIHIRRGDYVNNDNYVNLPPAYYTGALESFFPDNRRNNILVFSDDIAYARSIFPDVSNINYSEGVSDIDDLCLMGMCSNWIISNSSFSWWGAYLGSKQRGGTIVRPAQHFEGHMKDTHPVSDLYPEEWASFDYTNPDNDPR